MEKITRHSCKECKWYKLNYKYCTPEYSSNIKFHPIDGFHYSHIECYVSNRNGSCEYFKQKPKPVALQIIQLLKIWWNKFIRLVKQHETY